MDPVPSVIIDSPIAEVPQSKHPGGKRRSGKTSPRYLDEPSNVCSVAEGERAFASKATVDRIPLAKWHRSHRQRTIPADHCLVVATAPADEDSGKLDSLPHNFPGGKIERVAIGSCALLHEVAKLIGAEDKLSHTNNVFCPPFTPLWMYRDCFRQRLSELRTECDSGLDAPMTETAAVGGSSSSARVTEDTLNEEDNLHAEGGVKTLRHPPRHQWARKLMDELTCLVEFIDDSILYLGETPMVTFRDLKSILRPGNLVVWCDSPSICYCILSTGPETTRDDSRSRMSLRRSRSRIAYSRSRSRIPSRSHSSSASDMEDTATYDIESFTISFDGHSFLPLYKENEVYPFQGQRELESLGIRSVGTVKLGMGASLVEQGETFLEMARSPGREMLYTPQSRTPSKTMEVENEASHEPRSSFDQFSDMRLLSARWPRHR